MLPNPFAALFYQSVSRVRAVVERVEPLVPRRFPCAVIAVKEPVVQLVEEVPHLNALGARHFHTFETRMGCRGADPVVKQQEKHMQRMGRKQKEYHRVEH